MKYILSIIATLLFFVSSCQIGKLDVVGDIDGDLEEVSAVETVSNSSLNWVLEDAGNQPKIYGLSDDGNIQKVILIDDVDNDDWEDLTSDNDGNLYIGDFGNNSEKRKKFSILKIENISNANEISKAKKINFTLPKGVKSKDFEAFFLLNDHFYIFSKERKKAVVIKVPNSVGDHKAKFVSKYYLKGKDTEVTSADISDDGKTIVLLNHDRVWKLSNFADDKFFGGTVEELDLEHKSQKEGICFKSDSILYITDERNKSEGGNIYSLKL
ncbi:SdiA-regulated domain-containing protein [uncultured Winogradskyella sp.]|uniref:SdiA-regulated domain-containing protein n=1 Tax=uncultured Winogradskyella sp. TaxID=395353 RepID=UPI00262A84E4|nr:SdiA-regulated domain-containing protein [uncultured Winogradskyella sp.]